MTVDRGVAAVQRAATAKQRARYAKMRLAQLKARKRSSKRDVACAREAAQRSAALALEAEQRLAKANASHHTARERWESRSQGDRHAATRMVAETLGQLARLHQQPQDDHYLPTVAELCARPFGPGCEVSVTVGPPDEPSMRASSGPFAEDEDEAQRQHGGPTTEAWSRGVPVWSNGREGSGAGPATLALPALVGQEPLAVITAYAADSAPWGQLDADLLDWLASAVAALLLRVEGTQRLRTENRQLKQALTSRATIDQAKGIVMAQGHCGPDEAFDRLREASRNRNVKLREIARVLITQVQDDRRSR